MFDDILCWNENASRIIMEAKTRLLYSFRKLSSFGVSASLLAIFYNVVVSSALKIMKKVGHIDGIHNQSIEEIYSETVRCKLATVLNDSTRHQLADFDSNGME